MIDRDKAALAALAAQPHSVDCTAHSADKCSCGVYAAQNLLAAGETSKLPTCLDCGETTVCGFVDSDRNYGPICSACYRRWKAGQNECGSCGRNCGCSR